MPTRGYLYINERSYHMQIRLMSLLWLCILIFADTRCIHAQLICPIGKYTRGVISHPPPTGIDGDLTFHEFRYDGTGYSTQTEIQITGDIQSAEVLVIAGGGGGGATIPFPRDRGAGGGGAGRLIWLKHFDISAGTKNVIVGAGGAGGPAGTTEHWGITSGHNGQDSNFLGFTAKGGGAGGGIERWCGICLDQNGHQHGNDGGSGGGGGCERGNGGSASSENTVQSFGNVGGQGGLDGGDPGAGGGGAGGPGLDGSSGEEQYIPGLGGGAMNIDITGTMRGYAGGGQGGMHNQLDPTLQHMGHGGKAAHDYATSGFVGSSGVVIIRYNNTKCGTCPPGTYAATGSSVVCTLCEMGKFSPNAGSVACTPCEMGKTHNLTGQVSSVNCVALCPNEFLANVTTRTVTCVNTVSFDLFLQALPENEHEHFVNTIALMFGLESAMVRIEVTATDVRRRLLSVGYRVRVYVSVPEGDTRTQMSTLQVYRHIAGENFLVSTDHIQTTLLQIDGNTVAVSLNDFAMGMPLRVALNNNIQGTWLSGDKVFVYLEGKSGINSDVLTYVTDDSGGFRWSPVNCDPMLYINSTYVFFTSNHSIFLYFGIN